MVIDCKKPPHLFWSILLLLISHQPQTQAATFVVDNTQDSVFAAFTQCTSAPNDCSFRGAASKVNANPDADVIAFNIPAATDPGCVAATGICTFTPTVDTAFGLLFTSVVTIDGLTQPGASANTLAVPAGVNMEIKIQFQQNTTSQSIFHFRNSATLRGIATSSNPNETLQTTNRHIGLGELFLNAATPDFNFLRSYAIESCILGYNLNTNSVDYVEPNQSAIVELDNPTGAFVPGVGVVPYTGPINLQLGGVSPAQRNWFPSPKTLKVPFGFAGNPNIKAPFMINVEGNLFGSSKDGSAPLQSNIVYWDVEHVSVEAGQNPLSEINIGGSDLRKRNVFLRGVYTSSASTNFTTPSLTMGTASASVPNYFEVNPKIKVQGNYFGVAANGVSWFDSPAPFSGNGFVFGGIAPGEGNIAVRNQYALLGVRLDPIIRTTYLGNTHFDYAGPGLIRVLFNLIYDPNDLNDVDAGAQNFPKIISSTLLAPNQLQVRYLIDSAPANTVYPILVEFYQANGNDATVLLGRDTYTSIEAQTEKTVVLTLDPSVTFAADDIVLASSTPSDGGTSIFNWFPMFISHLGNNQIQINSPTTFTVQALADGPYAPRGVVKISVYDNNFIPNLLLTCNATFQSIGVGQSQASCAVPPGSNPVFSNPLITLTLRAEYEIQEFPFASETGDRIQVTRPVTVFQDRMFCHGFEDGQTGACP